MATELVKYYKGKNRLAQMMGVPPEAFSDKDVREALRYLLPTRLFAKDARPSMKVPHCLPRTLTFDLQWPLY